MFGIMEAYKEGTKEILNILEEVINKLQSMETLAVYRDFVTDFIVELEVRFRDWPNAKSAIYSKIRQESVNYGQRDKECISELQNFLQAVNMTVEDIELMIRFKKRSNKEFHKGEYLKHLEPKEARENFEASFPDSLKVFKDSFRRVFNALDHWDKYRNSDMLTKNSCI
ncbi:unnamed protein product [Rhizophagus irregularis]|uniref:Uncharacterized protein n=1 Tax=Rhizophagus irregularis TaxID=588596 RepID=A0A916E3J8_9GLOM|nr:unnamed protein product [Rhizophagus irregularis]